MIFRAAGANLSEPPRFGRVWVHTWFTNNARAGLAVVLGALAYDLSDSNAVAVAVTGAAAFAPLLLGPVGALFADRWPRPRLLAAAQVVALAGVVLGALLAHAVADRRDREPRRMVDAAIVVLRPHWTPAPVVGAALPALGLPPARDGRTPHRLRGRCCECRARSPPRLLSPTP